VTRIEGQPVPFGGIASIAQKASGLESETNDPLPLVPIWSIGVNPLAETWYQTAPPVEVH